VKQEKRDQVLLGFGSCVAHITLAASVLFKFGPTGNSAAWSIASQIWQEIVSPGMFFIIAIFAGVGVFNIRSLRISLYVGAVVMWIWALSLASAWVLGFGPQPSTIWIAFIGLLKWRYGDTWSKYDKQTARLVESAAAAVESIESVAKDRGHNAGHPLATAQWNH
jgi:hypothetical protein